MTANVCFYMTSKSYCKTIKYSNKVDYPKKIFFLFLFNENDPFLFW